MKIKFILWEINKDVLIRQNKMVTELSSLTFYLLGHNVNSNFNIEAFLPIHHDSWACIFVCYIQLIINNAPRVFKRVTSHMMCVK